MRVALDVTITARARTGIGVAARHLTAGLCARGLDVRAWRLDLAAGRAGLPRLLNALRLARWFALDVRRRVRREDVTVYHAPSSLGPPLGAGCPTVLTVHDATLLGRWAPPGRVDRLYWRVFSEAAARRAAAVVVPTGVTREAVIRAYRLAPERVHVVHHGVTPEFRPLPPAARAPVFARLGVEAPYVLYVGARPARKNLRRLIEAVGRLAPGGPGPLTLVVAGPPEPEDPEAVAAAGRLPASARVRWLGWVPESDLPALYGGALCLAYPSLEEGFGLPVLEAMACGVAVLTSAGTAMAEVAADAALLVDPRSVEAITEGLGRLRDDAALREELGARGIARARAFVWERTAEQTEAIYRQVARR